jgi:hypothetical protein
MTPKFVLPMLICWHGRWHVHPDERRNGQGNGRGIN